MLQTTSILFVFLPTLSVEAQPAEIRSSDGCIWVEGLGCELSYEAECHAYQSIDRPSLWPMLNELDWQYYENRCSYCLGLTDRDTCVSSEICEWSAGMCSYSKHTLASRAIQEPHSGGEDRVSFLRSEVAAHMMCQRVREAEDCRNVWGMPLGHWKRKMPARHLGGDELLLSVASKRSTPRLTFAATEAPHI
ncbi:hypothetical protein FOZ60_002978 [Perkinsus olseni]|uniref:Uncharacterized protein n=1 Tax=Perkinsus olseni TaxID=32597 RepID=A0A7J6NWJ0_PEROL|nr:hypothetical protein FOZ60_002978 [Perkinsus olseni]